MRNLARDAYLGMKTGERSGIFGEALGKKFYGYDLAEFQIFGAIDLAHSAASGQGHDAIALGDDLTGNEPADADGARNGENCSRRRGRANGALRRGARRERRFSRRGGSNGLALNA